MGKFGSKSYDFPLLLVSNNPVYFFMREPWLKSPRASWKGINCTVDIGLAILGGLAEAGLHWAN